MVKILAQAGMSLADAYNVVGSIAGVEQLESREVSLVHEMGGTLFSERYSQIIRSLNSGNIAQSTAFDTVIEDLPANTFRIFGIQIFLDNPTRIDFCSVAVRNPINGRELPIWAWNSAVDVETVIRFSSDGAAAGSRAFLTPRELLVRLPHMMAGPEQPQQVSSLAFRGQSTAFGAGGVTAIALVHLGFGQVAGISSRGLPIPGW